MEQQYLNIPTLDTKKQVYFKQNTPSVAAPAMQGTVGETVSQTVGDSYLANRARVSQEVGIGEKVALGIPIWYGINRVMDWLNPKFGGTVDESWATKIGNFGDKISDTKVGKATGKALDKFKAWTDKLGTKSKLVYTAKHHSTRPEWGFAKIPWKGTLGYLCGDVDQVYKNFTKPIGSNPQRLEQYGLNQKRINVIARKIKNLSKEEKILELQRLELKELGASKDVIRNFGNDISAMVEHAQKLKAEAFGFTSHVEAQKFFDMKNVIDNPKEAQKAFEKIAKEHPNWKASAWRNYTGSNPIMRVVNKVRSHLFGRKVDFSEYYHKFRIVNGEAATSRMGRALTKGTSWLMEGFSGRFGGGKLIPIMMAGIFAEMLIHSHRAPKGEKGKTLAERLVNDFSYLISLTMGIWGVHKVGGLKYYGLDEKGIAKYRKALENLNKAVDSGKLTKQRYKELKKAVQKKALGFEKVKNPFMKLLKRTGMLMNIGNERVHSYKSSAKWNMNWLRKLGNGNIIGVPLRIILPMMVVSPFIAKIMTKGAHAIFGKPTNSVLDEGMEEELTQENAQVQDSQNPQDPQAQQNPAPNAIAQNAQTPSQPKNPQDYADTNLIKMAVNGQKPTQYVRDINGKLVDAQKEPVRRYIPSPQGMVPQGTDTSAYDKAMAEADMAEKFINETMATTMK